MAALRLEPVGARAWRAAALVLAAACGHTAQAAEEAQMAQGRRLFTQAAQPACAVCHTLKDAGTQGTIGPVLDDLKPTAERVSAALRSGIGVMPAYEGQLTDAQIEALARYVSVASGAAVK